MNDEGVKLIFLDIDGVLNCTTTKERCMCFVGIDEEKLPLLKRIVDESAAKIILTSSWKENWYKNPFYKNKQDELASYLDEKLNKYGLKVFDKTFEDNPYHRGEGILNYLLYLNHYGVKISSFAILDDMTFDFRLRGFANYLVKTTMNSGLTEVEVNRALQILNKQKEKRA